MDKIDELVLALEKDFGKGVAVRGRDLAQESIVRVPIGVFILDYLTLGGLPGGKVTLLRGKEGSCKTLVALLAAKSYQGLCSECLIPTCKCKKPKKLSVCFMDAENKYPQKLAESTGIDFERFFKIRPENSEQAIDMIEQVLRNESVGFFILDSIASLVPMVEIEKSAVEWQQGYMAREINKAIRKMNGAMGARAQAGRAPTVVLINQDRFKIGIPYGDPSTIPGGEGQKFISSLILKSWPVSLRRENKDGDQNEMPTKITVKFTVMKHSYGPAHVDGEYSLLLHDGGGPCVKDEGWAKRAVQIAQARGLVEGSGKHLSLLGEKYTSAEAIERIVEADVEKGAALKRALMAIQQAI